MKKGVYSIKELGMLYFPNYTHRSAANALIRMIQQTPLLLEELQRLGYRPGEMRLFSPIQVQTIVDRLGEPQ